MFFIFRKQGSLLNCLTKFFNHFIMKDLQIQIQVMKGQEIENLWPVSNFNESYPDKGAIRKSALISLSDRANSDQVSLALGRVFIEKSDRIKRRQNYLVGLRFYSLGELVTVDVISVNKEFHREICHEHLQRMKWPSWSRKLNQPVDYFDNTTYAPFLFSGGCLQLKDDNKINFIEGSDSFGKGVFFPSANSLAAYISSLVGIKVAGDKSLGENFVRNILQITHQHKGRENFYEELVQNTFQQNSVMSASPSSQYLGSFLTMKALDRSIFEGENMLSIMTEEAAKENNITRVVKYFN